MSKMKPRFQWRHQYDEAADEREGALAGLECKDESLTQQSFTEDADLNVIARRYGLNDIPSQPLDPSFFRDTTQDPDLRTVLEYQRAARDNFLSLPAKLRKRFHNSPDELWEFINDPENADEAVKLGLLKRLEPSAAPPTSTPPASTSTNGATGSTNTPAPATSAGTTENPPNPPRGD